MTATASAFNVESAGDDQAAADSTRDADATAKAWLEAVVSPDGKSVEAIRYGWTFDADFSGQMLDSYDDDSDGKLEAAELREASQGVYDTIKEYRYFLLVSDNGKDIAVHRAAQRGASFANSQLSVAFEAKPMTPLSLHGKVELGIYDPTFSIDFGRITELSIDHLPAHCEKTIIEPDFDQVLSKDPASMTDTQKDDPDGAKTIRLFATRIALDCKG